MQEKIKYAICHLCGKPLYAGEITGTGRCVYCNAVISLTGDLWKVGKEVKYG